MTRTAPGDDRALAEAIERAASRVGVRVVSAYLFGSHAEGRSHRESDLDLGILLPADGPSGARERFEARVKLASALMAELHENALDVVLLRDVPPELARRIVTMGRRVLCADPEADAAFVREVQLRAADLEPFLRRTRAAKLRAILR